MMNGMPITMLGNTDFQSKDTADKFINGRLKTLVETPIYNAPGGVTIRTSRVGEDIGAIYAWVQRPDGIYWQLDTIPFTFVKHHGGRFDIPYLEKTLAEYNQKRQSEIDKKVEARKDANTSWAYNIGRNIQDALSMKNLKTIGFVAGGVVLIALFLRIKGPTK